MELQLMRKGVITKTRGNSFFPVWVRQRELRQRLPLGHSDAFYKSLYSYISQCHSWNREETLENERGLFSLEFSPDGTLLVAGCENRSFLMFDPLSRKLIRAVDHAHTRCITDVKFLDSRTFATGSADRRVSLWDTRNLRSPLQTLFGYSEVTRNLEFSRKNNFLISSGPSDTIYIWDIKNWNRIMIFNTFMPHHLQKLRLSPDETKMIISSANGYLLIVHDLDLNRFVQDMRKFVLEMTDSTSLLQANTMSGWSSNRFVLPKHRRNRVEIVADFPNGRGFISALDMHPQGRSVISRSKGDRSQMQFICVHDIQDKKPSESGGASRGGSGDENPPFGMGAKRQRLDGMSEEQCSSRGHVGGPEPSSNHSGPERPDAAFRLERRSRKRRFVSRADAARARSPPPGPSSAPPQPFEPGSIPASTRVQDPTLPPPISSVAQFNRRVHIHVPRLTHFIEEPRARWYSSELCVSSDGRLVCSPVERGIRLLAFSPECSEQSVSGCGTGPRPLYELSTHIFDSDCVLSVRFSPRYCSLVCGTLDGKLKWYQPVV